MKKSTSFIFFSIFSLSTLWASDGFCLTRFPQGICILQGRLVKATNEPFWYFIVNSGTQGETRFKLDSFQKSSPWSENGQFVEVNLEIPKMTFSQYGQAKILEIKRMLNPFDEVQQYLYSSETDKICTQKRTPSTASPSKSIKKK